MKTGGRPKPLARKAGFTKNRNRMYRSGGHTKK